MLALEGKHVRPMYSGLLPAAPAAVGEQPRVPDSSSLRPFGPRPCLISQEARRDQSRERERADNGWLRIGRRTIRVRGDMQSYRPVRHGRFSGWPHHCVDGSPVVLMAHRSSAVTHPTARCVPGVAPDRVCHGLCPCTCRRFVLVLEGSLRATSVIVRRNLTCAPTPCGSSEIVNQHALVDAEDLYKLCNQLTGEALLACKHFRNRRPGDSCAAMQLRLAHPLCFHKMPQHVGI